MCSSNCNFSNARLSYGGVSWRLGLSIGLGGVIGLQREMESHPAGLRTHMMVSIGSCLFSLISAYSFYDFEGFADPGRIAAQVVSGIGFLGAGAIVRHGLDVRGLTTAGTLWVTSAIGMACAYGSWYPAILATVAVLFVLEVFKRLEALYWKNKQAHVVRIENVDSSTLSKIVSLLAANQIQIDSMHREDSEASPEKFHAVLSILLPRHFRQTPTVMLNILRGVEELALTEVILDGRNRSAWLSRDSEANAFVAHGKQMREQYQKEEADRRNAKISGPSTEYYQPTSPSAPVPDQTESDSQQPLPSVEQTKRNDLCTVS